jgi:hypothetical protein
LKAREVSNTYHPITVSTTYSCLYNLKGRDDFNQQQSQQHREEDEDKEEEEAEERGEKGEGEEEDEEEKQAEDEVPRSICLPVCWLVWNITTTITKERNFVLNKTNRSLEYCHCLFGHGIVLPLCQLLFWKYPSVSLLLLYFVCCTCFYSSEHTAILSFYT